MKASEHFSWNSGLRFRPNERLVTIYVGPDEEVYHAHKSVLINSSDLLGKALSNPAFVESSTGEVRLPEADPRAFPLWLEFAYSGKLPSAALDAGSERNEPDEAATSNVRQSVIYTAACMLAVSEAPTSIILSAADAAEIPSFDSQSMMRDNARGSSRWKSIGMPHGATLANIHRHIDSLKDKAEVDAHECTRLREAFLRKFEALLRAQQPDAEFQAALASGAGGLAQGLRAHTTPELRPSYIHLVRLYTLADFLLSEDCMNRIINVVAELSAITAYVPNAVDVGEVWGYDGKVGSLDELLNGEGTGGGLKTLIRHVYSDRKTSRLILEEEDPYPEVFLRELYAMPTRQRSLWKQWGLQKNRCEHHHVHRVTPCCLKPDRNAGETSESE